MEISQKVQKKKRKKTNPVVYQWSEMLLNTKNGQTAGSSNNINESRNILNKEL